VAKGLPAEVWALKPPSEWPQMVLTNLAEFRGHTSLNGASSFLVQTPDGRVVAATAKHLLGENGGVEPTVEPGQLGEVLSSWHMHPRTKPEATVAITGLGFPLPVDKDLDWLLLTLDDGPKNLPSLPLQLRRAPVTVGEEVFLVGVPYSEPEKAQNVYRGRVTERRFGDRFRYTVDPPVDIRGFSGAPIVDGHGHVVGVMTIWFDPKMQGEKFLEAGGEDAVSLLKQLSKN
jgi:hypothetical protein